ncbi:MAG TPA: saccharopine dehydrogenase NADP-binding domain-containing protein [Acidimicrobiales bacterium]|nr:saccharopine dehydrogenase NADP-binding domain-containing protein [Acidimicrobiales bacterium]
MTTWMIYGAYGYTGRLVAALAAERGGLPVLAGRDERRLRALGERFELEHRIVDLSDAAALRAALDGIDVVAHCAGPFSATSLAMVDACLATGTHYLDITGEIDVFEAVLARDDEARDRGVVLLPGAGFDVVPSDCLAALLARAMPDAVSLELAIRATGGVSPGTARTAMESLGTAGRARVAGIIAAVPGDRRRRTVDFADGRATAHAIAWGDVSTAYHSTGIPNVVVYAALPPALVPMVALAQVAGPAARSRVVQGMLKRVVGRLPGPSAQTRAKTQGQLWGQVTDASGRSVAGTVTTLDPYDLTADAVVRIADRLGAGAVAPGAYTPSRALGADFVRELDGATVHAIG